MGRRLIISGAVLAFLALAISFYLDRFWQWLYLASLAGLLAMVVYLKPNWGLKGFLPIVVFLLPLSFSWELSPGVKIVVPSEFLLATAALVLVLEIGQQAWTLLRSYPWPALWLLSFIPPLIQSDLPLVSLKYLLINTLFVAVFYYGILHWRKKGGSFNNLVKAFALGMLPIMVYALINYGQYDFNPVTKSGIYQPFFYSHTIFGASAAFVGAYALGRALKHPKWWWAAILFLTVAILSGSRAALWSVVFIMVFIPLFYLPARLRLWPPLGLLSLFLVLGGPQKLEESFSYNKYQSYDPQADLVEKSMSVTNVQSDVSNIERLNRWVSALRMFEERPHYGFGPGTYQFTYIPFQEKKLENRLTVRNPDYPPEGSGGTAHSELLLQLSENGWPSLLLFLIILGRWFYHGFFSGKDKHKLILPLFLALASYYFHMQFNNFLNQASFAFLFWSFGAVLEQNQKPGDHELLR